MEWINVQEELPKTRKRYLAKCMIGYSDDKWSGIVDVYFDPHIGWLRCESPDTSVFVTHYTDHPCPDYPFEEKCQVNILKTNNFCVF